MSANSIWADIEQSAFGSTIASSEWMFPTIETVHVIAIVSVIGAIVAMDLRLLGLTSMKRTVSAVAADTIPLTWVAFALAVITGLLLFVSKATSYMANPYFLWKMGIMAFAGLNMAVFHRMTARNMADWDAPGAAVPTAAKVSGLLSLACWAMLLRASSPAWVAALTWAS